MAVHMYVDYTVVLQKLLLCSKTLYGVWCLPNSECLGWCKWTHDTSALVAIQYTTYISC